MSRPNQEMSLAVEAFMTRRLYTVGPEDRVYDVVQQLVKRGYSGCPVVEDGRIVGVISEKDCIRALMRAVVDRLPASFVRDVMSTQLITIQKDTTLLSAAHLFLQHPIRRLPVVDEKMRLLGQVSRSDLLSHAVKVFDSVGSRSAAVLYLSAIEGTQPPVDRR